MACFVRGCKSHSSNKQTGGGHVSFHIMPKEAEIQEKWLEAIPRARTNWTKHSRICSKHFTPDSYINPNDKWRKLKPDAVPSLFMGVVYIGKKKSKVKPKKYEKNETDSDEDEEDIDQICRVCLETNSKFYSLKQYNLDTIYTEVTGLIIHSADNLPEYVCVECAHRLNSCWKLRSKALRASNLLVQLLEANHSLTHHIIQSIDRHTQNLTSTLTYKIFNVNHTDLTINDTNIEEIQEEELPAEEEVPIEEEKLEISSLDVEIKNESEIDGYASNLEDVTNLDDNEGRDQTDNNIDTFNFDDISNHSNNSNTSNDIKLSELQNNLSNEKDNMRNGDEYKIKRKRQKKDANGHYEKELVLKAMFDIRELSYEEQIAEMKKREGNEQYQNSDFKCVQCFKGFMDEEIYKCHMERHSEKSGAYLCEICKVRFRNLREVRTHSTKAHGLKYSCRICTFVTMSREVARRHKGRHEGVKHACPQCNYITNEITNLNNHMRIQHPSDVVCEFCGFSFINSRGLSLHKTVKHRNGLTVPADGPSCEECEIRFISEAALQKHLRVSTRHSGNMKPRERNGTLPVKRKKGMKNEDGTKMKRKQPPQGPIACEECDMQLATLRGYHLHFRRMHPDSTRIPVSANYMCELCGKFFHSVWHLNDHSNIHTGKKQFKCDQCGKTFFTKGSMMVHLKKLHSEQKKTYPCKVCGKEYTSASNLIRHMVSHTGVKSHKCEICGKCFSLNETKKLHITYVHLKKPWPKRNREKRRNRQITMPPQPPALPQTNMSLHTIWPPCNDTSN